MTENEHIQTDMPKAYEASAVEDKWYDYWQTKNYFKPVIDPAKKPFTIIMPPPNVTGELHVGHALTATLEDIMIRWHRMLGDPALWIPGVDHSGIAAQVVVERMLAKEKTTRYELGREKFDIRMQEWAARARASITNQHKKLGVSCDWSREAYTLDPGPSLAVRTTFFNLYRKGLIYRGERITNWCPRCATVLSDLETEHKDENGHLWYIRYPLEKNGGYLTVATTRPETMLGDTAVAVNPRDARFSAWIGQSLILPLLNRPITILADEAIDMAFGTGAVKVTPAHDPVDFEIGQRHQLPSVNILNNNATLNENAGPYRGLDRFEARKQIVEDLKNLGLLEKIEEYAHAVGHCQRCQTIIEPLASKQWFVRMPPLAKPAIEAVKDGRIKIIPERFEKIYLSWMENIRDWCISRQLWWGHRIPVWYCLDCAETNVSITDITACRCGSTRLKQDTDVLDTWFSSGLWPHCTLGWPNQTTDLKYFYPTSVMETGYDIIFHWVARMIMLGIENTGEIPFRTVYLHGMVRDEKGEKMSKVKGNVLNPLDAIREYGTDALRFALSTGTSPGNDMKMSATRLEASRNFANKIWNAARFVIKNCDGWSHSGFDQNRLAVEDRWILSRLNSTIDSALKLMEDFQFGEAQRQIYDFLWSEFCDWYIEIAKIRLRDPQAYSPVPVLVHVLDNSLRLLHPFMPFITEEIWQILKRTLDIKDWTDSIMIAPYPRPDLSLLNASSERIIQTLIDIVRSIRNTRAERKVESSRLIEARIYAGDLAPEITKYYQVIQSLAQIKPLEIVNKRHQGDSNENELVLVLKDTEVIIPLASMIDFEAEKIRLQKEYDGVKANVERLETRLSDTAFTGKAPPAVIEKERSRLAESQDKMHRLAQQLTRFMK
ncbi:MAG TPA: valine--tRNA ligase [Dehalococcoidales bacterium]|nr:valine--tRNA ligase [Dehalococcoidales bacterium]